MFTSGIQNSEFATTRAGARRISLFIAHAVIILLRRLVRPYRTPASSAELRLPHSRLVLK